MKAFLNLKTCFLGISILNFLFIFMSFPSSARQGKTPGWGGGVKGREEFRLGEGGKTIRRIYLYVCENLKGTKNVKFGGNPHDPPAPPRPHIPQMGSHMVFNQNFEK